MKMSSHLGCMAAFAILVGCKPGKGGTSSVASPSTPPAKVITENDLATVVLKPEAEERLGIVTVPVVQQKVGRIRSLGGELLLPLGRPGGAANADASTSKSIYSLLPAMTPTELVRVAEMQVDADGQIAAAQVQVDAAKIALARAESLVVSKAGPQRGVDDARAQAQLAEAALRTARERRAMLGAPLFDAVRRDVLWIRVPVYAGDLDQISRSAPVRVSNLGKGTNGMSRAARPVNVPFSPSAAPATVDLFYELESADGSLRPGQKVTVMVPMEGETESLVVPAAAVLYDIHGGTWSYENTAPHSFTRRRIEVRYVSDAGAVLARGPLPGAKVVTAGAAELFGAEFGIGK
jgi:hypothetical protein